VCYFRAYPAAVINYEKKTPSGSWTASGNSEVLKLFGVWGLGFIMK